MQSKHATQRERTCNTKKIKEGDILNYPASRYLNRPPFPGQPARGARTRAEPERSTAAWQGSPPCDGAGGPSARSTRPGAHPAACKGGRERKHARFGVQRPIARKAKGAGQWWNFQEGHRGGWGMATGADKDRLQPTKTPVHNSTFSFSRTCSSSMAKAHRAPPLPAPTVDGASVAWSRK